MPIVQNASGCCEWVPTKESAPVETPRIVDQGCEDIKSSCGIVTPVGSGTLAGCKSTTLPHFGTTLGARTENGYVFGYYTSGNTEEYENVCGGTDRLTHAVTEQVCKDVITFEAESCDCFDNAAANAGQAAIDVAQNLLIAGNTDNTVVGTVTHGGQVYNVLEDGSEVLVDIEYVDLAGAAVTPQ